MMMPFFSTAKIRNLFSLRRPRFLLLLRLLLLSMATIATGSVHDGNETPTTTQPTVQSHGRFIRYGSQHHHQQIYRLTVSETLWRHVNEHAYDTEEESEDEETVDSTEDVVAIPIVQGEETDAFYTVLPESFSLQDLVFSDDGTQQNDIDLYTLLERGQLFVATTGARLRSDHVLVFSEDADIVVLPESPIVVEDLINRRQRELQNGIEVEKDERRIAALRVSMADGPKPFRQVSYSAREIHQQLFESDVGFTKQLHACSGGVLNVIPGGVYEVTVPGKFIDYDAPSAVRDLALHLLAQQYKVSSAKALADHILVILPPNNFPYFVGNAAVHHWVMTVNDLWGLDVNVYMHELGHNLGLSHASTSDGGGDYSSYMSATGHKPNRDGPRKCYNAADNRQLGWWDAVNVPLEAGKATVLRIAAFSEPNPQNLPTLLTVGRYSLQYNYASNFNFETETLRDKVTIVHEEPGKTIVQRQGLSPDGSILVLPTNADSANNNDPISSQKSYIQMEACESDGATMVIGISLDRLGSPCVPSPGQIQSQTTKEPTPEPTPEPTKKPTRQPTMSPTLRPTPIPTPEPTKSPTLVPTPEPTVSPSYRPSTTPTSRPSSNPTSSPSTKPSSTPTSKPSSGPTVSPSSSPSESPTFLPTVSSEPSSIPSTLPTLVPSLSVQPSIFPSNFPTQLPSNLPSESPSTLQSQSPSSPPSTLPSNNPSILPSSLPSMLPSNIPSTLPSNIPSILPSSLPSMLPSSLPNTIPSNFPSTIPSNLPSMLPSNFPSHTAGEPTPIRFIIPTPTTLKKPPPVGATTNFGRFQFGEN